MLEAVVARLHDEAAALPRWDLADVKDAGLATGLTALAASLGLFDDAEDDVTAYAAEQRAAVAARAGRFSTLTPVVLDAFATADLPALPVKGAVLGGSSGDAPSWPQAELRPMSDIDLIVHPRHRAQAAAVVARAGLSWHASTPYEDTFLAWGDGGTGRTDGESPAHNGRVEVHPGWQEFLHGYAVNGPELFGWARRRSDGQWRLDAAAFATHVVGHLASTVLRAEVRAVNIVDVIFLNRSGLDWDEVAHRMAATDPRLTAPGLWIVDCVAPGVVPAELCRREMGRMHGAAVLATTDPAAVLRDPTQRTAAAWRVGLARGASERIAVGRQLAVGAVGRLR